MVLLGKRPYGHGTEAVWRPTGHQLDIEYWDYSIFHDHRKLVSYAKLSKNMPFSLPTDFSIRSFWLQNCNIFEMERNFETLNVKISWWKSRLVKKMTYSFPICKDLSIDVWLPKVSWLLNSWNRETFFDFWIYSLFCFPPFFLDFPPIFFVITLVLLVI